MILWPVSLLLITLFVDKSVLHNTIAGLGIIQGYCTYSRAVFAKAYVCMLEEGGS